LALWRLSRAAVSGISRRDIATADEDTAMSPLPATMTAIAIDGKGGPEVLMAREIARPEPGPGQMLIAVAFAGLNRPDVLQRQGLYPAPKGHSEIPGLEVAGRIAAVGPGATRFAVGDAVMALVNGGGYAEYCIAEEPACLPVPSGLSLAEAAAIPETFFTVWHNVFERGGLKSGEWLLVHGGTSGIGVTAIQLAKALGARVITTAGSADKCAACRALGADVAVDYNSEDFGEAVKAATEGRGVDVILDMVGGDYVDRNIRALADDGRLVNIAFQKGSKVQIDMMRVMLKRLTLTGSTLRVRPTTVKGAIARAVEATALPLVAAGKIKIVIDRTFALTDAAAAHARMEAGQHIGKIVLKV
jgi:NADPH2:quinone reductase